MQDDSTSAHLPKHATDVTSLSLLDRVKAQENVAWEGLVNLYSPLVFVWCQRSGLSLDDSRDISQDVFAIVARKISQFRRDRQGDTFRGWLRVVTRNAIRLHCRKQAGRPVAQGGSTAQLHLQQISDEPLEDPDSETDQGEVSGLYQRAIELLKTEFEESTWRAFLMSAVDGRNSTEIARDLDMSPGAVRQAKYRVLRRLRSEMGDLLE